MFPLNILYPGAWVLPPVEIFSSLHMFSALPASCQGLFPRGVIAPQSMF